MQQCFVKQYTAEISEALLTGLTLVNDANFRD
jgi:hypothetical protein